MFCYPESFGGQTNQSSKHPKLLEKTFKFGQVKWAFQTAVRILKTSGHFDPLTVSFAQIAAALIQLHAFSPAQARNAYSGVLLIPGFSHFRFETFLIAFKKLWHSINQRYDTFWIPSELVPTDLLQLRNR